LRNPTPTAVKLSNQKSNEDNIHSNYEDDVHSKEVELASELKADVKAIKAQIWEILARSVKDNHNQQLAELRAELATVKANQSQFVHQSELAEVRAELATVKANQSHIRAQLTEHSATLNEQAEIRAEHAELIAALAEIRADHGQILRSSTQLRAEPVEEIAELKVAIKEILATLKEMVSCS
jgi:hypothetical protein